MPADPTRTRPSFALGPERVEAINRWAADKGMDNSSEALRQMIDVATASTDSGCAALLAERDALQAQLADTQRQLREAQRLLGSLRAAVG